MNQPTHLPGNPEAANTITNLDRVAGLVGIGQIVQVIAANTTATLALAHEVRTANLIALLDHLRSNTEYGPTQADWHELQDQITTRLGFDQETPNADH